MLMHLNIEINNCIDFQMAFQSLQKETITKKKTKKKKTFGDTLYHNQNPKS